MPGINKSQSCFLTVFCCTSLSINISAQEETLESITIRSSRTEQAMYSIPSAVSIIDAEDIQTGRQQLGLDESLSRIPGLFMQNRYNFTQDLRIAIRGFGARASFGIRGLKLFSDEIPATLADGQSGVDDIDLGSAQRIEVIRGPSSSLYGSSSGGVISVFTEDGPKTPFVESALTFGEYNQRKYQLKTGGQYDRLNYLINASYLTMDGYRNHSEVEHVLLNSKFRYDIDENSTLTVIVNAVDSPTAQDAGAITAADAAVDPQQAQARNVASNAGEELTQQKLGLVYHKSFGDQHQVTLRNYYLWRDFETFLPIGTHIPFVANDGIVAFDRFFFGGGGQYTNTSMLFGRNNRLMVGFDIDIQEDDRQRFLNNAGIKGTLSFDQLEEVESYGFYVRNEIDINKQLTVTVGGRYDIVDLSVNDRFLGNGNQSSKISFNEFNPTVGVVWDIQEDTHLYANYASSFETPTFTELANPARNSNVNLGGFNNVNAQNADSFEIGLKGSLYGRVNYDIAAYTMQVDDEIVSVANIGNRAFFQNADTERAGLEASVVVDLTEDLRLTTAYTYSDFEFDKFPSNILLENNILPGLPEQQFYGELAYRHDSGLYIVGDVMHINEFFANNANTVTSDSYTVVNLRGGYKGRLGNWDISPFVGLNNLFDESYMSNVRLNAFGGRFFEPAPEINIYAGISIKFNNQ